MKIHDGEENFKCDVCKQEFTSQKSLSRHKTIHIKRNQMFKCQVCSKNFKTEEEVREHTKSVHYGLPVTRGISFKCGICKQMFAKGRDLKKHLWMKHGKETYAGMFNE